LAGPAPPGFIAGRPLDAGLHIADLMPSLAVQVDDTVPRGNRSGHAVKPLGGSPPPHSALS